MDWFIRECALEHLESNVYDPDAWTSMRKAFDMGGESNSKPTVECKNVPLDETVWKIIKSHEDRYVGNSLDAITSHFLQQAGIIPSFKDYLRGKRAPERVTTKLAVKYNGDGSAAMCLEAEAEGRKSAHIYIMDARDALLFEIGFKSDKLDELRYSDGDIIGRAELSFDRVERVFGEPVDAKQHN